jgi:hypothetical protein
MQLPILIMLVIGITSIIVSWIKADLNCPQPKVIYRYIPKNTLDVQFSTENMPSEIYSDMFNKGNIWIGGYNLDSGRTGRGTGTGTVYSLTPASNTSTTTSAKTLRTK